jgi:hypothetical protein
MKLEPMFASHFLAPFNKAMGVIGSLWLLSGVALGQEAVAPAKVAEEQRNVGVEALIMEKLNAIIIPVIYFEDVAIEEALDFIRMRARDCDVTEKDPTRKGISFHTTRPPAAQAGGPAVEGNGEERINHLQLRNVSMLSALKYTCLLSNLSFSVTERGIVITPKMQGAKEPVIPINQVARQELINRLNTITIPQVDFTNVSIDEAIAFLRNKLHEQEPQKIEINFVIGPPVGDKKHVIEKLQMKETTISKFLKSICEAAHYDITIDDAAVILMPQKS